MKSRISLVLAALMLLCGCTAQAELPAAPPATSPAPVVEPFGIYDQASEIETKTCGAIKAYPLGIGDAAGILSLGSDLLVFSGDDATVLTRYHGEDLKPSATAVLNCPVSPADAAVRANEDGITYYDILQKELVFLDETLTETKRFALPEDILGSPAFSEDLQKLYYSTGNTLRCIDLTTGLTRLVKEMYAATITPFALHCNDTVIACDCTDDGGKRSQLYICAETGQLLHESTGALALQTCADSYFAQNQDGAYTELLLGSSEHGPTLLVPHTYRYRAFPLLPLGGAVLVMEDASSVTTQLDYYDLQSGKRVSSITIGGAEKIRSVFALSAQQVWFLRYDSQYGCDVLYCWDRTKTDTADSRSCLSSRHSPENPDWAGLAACRDIADRLSEQYGVQIYFWTEATVHEPWDYTLVPEHQIPVIEESLKELERFLCLYPDGFFLKAAQPTASGRIQICLVRGILGKEGAEGALSEAVGLQFWDENRNSYLCLSTGHDGLFRNACHEMSHIIDSRVLTYCKAYDDWNSLNPEGFRYTYDYSLSLSRDYSRWIDGEKRAFIDLYATTYPKEDRARIMEYAITAGNDAYFASETMQQKLRTICLGIRQAFDLKSSTETFRWEQYLAQPIA